MRYSRTAWTTLLVTGLASLAYGQLPVRDAGHTSWSLMAGPAVTSSAFYAQEKPKETPARPPKAERQEMPSHEKPQKADQKNDKHQSMKAEKKQDKEQAKQEKKEDKNAGGKHGRVPDKDYKAHFGQEHKVRARQIITTTHIVPNQTRFVYTGYTFVFLQPWPMGWGFDDDVYIDYVDGGWYMLDPMHPGVQLGLSIVF